MEAAARKVEELVIEVRDSGSVERREAVLALCHWIKPASMKDLVNAAFPERVMDSEAFNAMADGYADYQLEIMIATPAAG